MNLLEPPSYPERTEEEGETPHTGIQPLFDALEMMCEVMTKQSCKENLPQVPASMKKNHVCKKEGGQTRLAKKVGNYVSF